MIIRFFKENNYKKLKTKKPELVFFFSRLFGLVIKPISIILLTKIGLKSQSLILSEYYLIISSFFIIYNNEAHIDYYKILFDGNKYSKKIRWISLYKYVSDFIEHCFFITIFITLSILLFNNVFKINLIFFILLVVEKFWDEIQRYLIYSQRYIIWSYAFLTRSFFPVLTLLITQNIEKENVLLIFLFSVIFFNFIVYYFLLKTIKINFYIIEKTKIRFFNYIKKLKIYFFRQFYSFLIANIYNIDKWIIKYSQESSIFMEVVFLGQISNLQPILIDNFFLAKKRKEFIKKKEKIIDIIEWKKMLIVTFLVNILILSFSFFVKINGFYFPGLSLISIYFIVSCFFLHSLSIPLSEYLYWHRPRKILILINIFYYSLILTTFFIFLKSKIELIYIIIFFTSKIRLFILFLFTKQTILIQKMAK